MALSVTSKTESLLTKTRDLEAKLRPRLADLISLCDRLTNAALGLRDSWSGSYAGYHSELYYGDFEKPPFSKRFSREWGGIHGIPEGWRPRQPEAVKQRIEFTAGVDLGLVENQTGTLLKEAEELQNELVVELSPLYGDPVFEREKAILEKIEHFKWEVSFGDLIDAAMPKTFVSRDSEAMMQGIRRPAHLFYELEARVYRSRCESVTDFLKLSQRLLRQIQVQASAVQVPPESKTSTVDLPALICRRFHVVARQLTHRRENRTTLEITDEYDVQDLLHALLRLHFDDIRPEEWTPSYGGGASRMDFLLKGEQIVVEAKMTRAGLGAREVVQSRLSLRAVPTGRSENG